MAESHVLSGLVTKRSELTGEIDYHQNQIKKIKADLAAIDRAIKIFEPGYDLRRVKSKAPRIKNHFFKNGEGNTLLMDVIRDAEESITTQQIVEETARRKGIDMDTADRKALSACVFTIMKRLQKRGYIKEASRENNVIQWESA